MIYENLIENLNNPNAQARQTAVLILGMVDEVRAIVPMQKRYARESNRNSKQAIQTIGGQLAKLKRNGYDTVEAIFQHFGVDASGNHVPPEPPRTESIQMLIEDLESTADTETRCRIIGQLQAANNPGALPYLAQIHWLDEDEQVQTCAKQAGIRLYWKLLYWEMSQDGRLDQRIRLQANQPDFILPDQDVKPSNKQP